MSKKKLVKTISYKNANKEIKKVYLNGILNREDEDYILTNKGIKFIPSLEIDNFPTIVTVETIKHIKVR